MTYRLRNLGLAIALAAVAVLLVFYYVSQERGRLQEDQELVPVWVAAKDIPVGTSGAELDAGGYLTPSEVERGQVAPGALLDPADVATKVVAEQIYKGEQVSQLRSARRPSGASAPSSPAPSAPSRFPEMSISSSPGRCMPATVSTSSAWNVPENATNHVSRTSCATSSSSRPRSRRTCRRRSPRTPTRASR